MSMKAMPPYGFGAIAAVVQGFAKGQRSYCCHALACLGLGFSVAVCANPAMAADGKRVTELESPPEPEEETSVDIAHDYVSLKVRDSAQWFDTFFDDPNFIAEDASTRLRVRTDMYVSQKDEEKFSANFNLKLHLPKLSRKLNNQTSLLLGGDETLDDFGSDESNSIDNAFNDAIDDPTIGIQYFLLLKEKYNVDLTAGVKLSGLSLFAGPRARYVKTLSENSLLRFVERLRWYTDDGWDSRTRIDYDRSIGRKYLFRQTFDARWREERRNTDGFRLLFATSLTERLSKQQAVAYRWNTVFKTEPHALADSTVFLVQYRRRIYRKWLYYELLPQLAFQDEHDWEANPGITLRLEVVFRQ
jgi:hypothetical protein